MLEPAALRLGLIELEADTGHSEKADGGMSGRIRLGAVIITRHAPLEQAKK